MNSERSEFAEKKTDKKESSITIDIDISKESEISSQNLGLYLNDSIPEWFFRRRSSLDHYPIEEIVIANTLGKLKKSKNKIIYSSHIRLSNFTPQEEKNKATASSDSELHKKVLSPKKRLPDLFPQRSTVYNISADAAENINSVSTISGRYHAESISSVDLISPRPTNDRDMKIFWLTIIFLIIYAYFSRLIYSFRSINN